MGKHIQVLCINGKFESPEIIFRKPAESFTKNRIVHARQVGRG
jgi:hypothetical protein